MLACNTDNYVFLPDGRRLAYGEFGDSQGFPVFYFHGFPGSRLEALFSVEMAHNLGARVIAVERPGYGQSSQHTSRLLTDWSDDVANLADALNIGEFSILGVSAGSVYALVCANKLSQRLRRVGIAGALAPMHVEELVQKMHWQNRHCFNLTRKNTVLSRLIYGRLLGSFIRHFPGLFMWTMAQTAADADRQVLVQPQFRLAVRQSMREAYRQGFAGPYQDLVLVSRDWGFTLEDIGMPIHLWHGALDSVVPVEMGQFIAEELTECKPRFLPDDGHFSMTVNYMEEALRTLMQPVDEQDRYKTA